MMEISEDSLFQSVKEIIVQSREKVFRIANSTLLLSYWQIGKLIVEDEQNGKERAEYGKYTLKNLSKKLTLELEKVLIIPTFPICVNFIWHFQLLLKIDFQEKINYYIEESIQNNWRYLKQIAV